MNAQPMGTFAYHDAAFAELLWARGTANEGDCYPARNFLLDERVPEQRAATYLSDPTPTTRDEWSRMHRFYEAEYLRISPRIGRIPHSSESVEPRNLPQTFEAPSLDDEFLHASSELHLVRVESVARLAEPAGTDPDALATSLSDYLMSGIPSPTDQLWLLSILDAFAAAQVLRPVFAGFADDVRETLADRSASGRSILRDLRDRFGLMHYDPADSGPVALAVFRYPISALPRIAGRQGVTLVAPTVLESGRSPAFCPSPPGSRFGTAVDLSATSAWPAREVLHLPFRYSPEHLVLSGVLQDPVAGTIARRRRRHLEALHTFGDTHFARDTDADILADSGVDGEPRDIG